MLDLMVVIPVYNEEACVVRVVCSWREMLDGLGMRYRILVLNDGSRDGTAHALETFQDDARIEVINKANSGHGPTILLGYERAVAQAAWVFQCDSDDEMTPDAFPALWERREQFDALFGYRLGRQQHIGRQFISACSRATVALLFAPGIVDVNIPYRLMRAPLLADIIRQIPADTFAPNVIIAGAFAKAGARIYNHPTPYESRKTGTVSIAKWTLWRAAFRSFRQTLQCRPTLTLPSQHPPAQNQKNSP